MTKEALEIASRLPLDHAGIVSTAQEIEDLCARKREVLLRYIIRVMQTYPLAGKALVEWLEALIATKVEEA